MAKKAYTKKSVDFEAEIVEKIIASLESAAGGVCEGWNKNVGRQLRINHEPYRGINQISTSYAAEAAGYTHPVWAGFSEIKRLGGSVRKGERGTLVSFVASKEITQAEYLSELAAGRWVECRDGKFFRLRLTYSRVWNLEQTQGLDIEAHRPSGPSEVVEDEQLIAAARHMGVTFEIGGSRAFYAPWRDGLRMPPAGAFFSAAGWKAVMLHELGHATGHKSRLDRNQTGDFGSAEYAYEELVAEFASAMTCAALGISDQPRPDHAVYITNWVSILKDDKRVLRRAAGEAQRACDMIVEAVLATAHQEGETLLQAA